MLILKFKRNFKKPIQHIPDYNPLLLKAHLLKIFTIKPNYQTNGKKKARCRYEQFRLQGNFEGVNDGLHLATGESGKIKTIDYPSRILNL